MTSLGSHYRTVAKVPARMRGLILSGAGLLVNSCLSYQPCGDLKVGDRVRVEVTEIYWGDPCSPAFPIGEGSLVDVTVTGSLRGERCESATGTVDIGESVAVVGPLEMEDEEDAHSAFFGLYEVNTSTCSGTLELSLSFPDSSRGGVSVDIVSTTCDKDCHFNSHGLLLDN